VASKQEERQELWRGRIAQQAESGRSVPAFCKENGLAEHAFYYWRLKFRRDQKPMTFALVEAKQPGKESSGIELVLAQGDRLCIPNDEATLRLVLNVLREQR
jgi:transposase-like protein